MYEEIERILVVLTLRAAGGGRELNWILFLTLARLGRWIAEGILQQCAADFIACVSQILFVCETKKNQKHRN